MNIARGINDRHHVEDEDDGTLTEQPLLIGTDERRMHVRAYNYWVSLLNGRPFPAIADLEPANLPDFGHQSVLLDFTAGAEDPAIRYLGRALREECGVDGSITNVTQVPSRSLLSRLTDHYLQIIANRAPIGFEAEFVSHRGHMTMYRGILTPFSSDGETIDFIYGVINWKELVDAETQARLNEEIAEARRTAPRAVPSVPVWADGPSAGVPAASAPPLMLAKTGPVSSENATLTRLDPTPSRLAEMRGSSLSDRLMLARESAAAARASDSRTRAALYRALSRAYDFACAAEDDRGSYAMLLDAAGLCVQERAPMTPAVKLVFGSDYDKTRLTEFAAVLANARRNAVPSGKLEAFLDAAEGGIKGVVRDERALRHPDARADIFARAAAELRERPTLAHVPIAAGTSEFVVLLARASSDGLDVVAALSGDPSLTERAVRKAAA